KEKTEKKKDKTRKVPVEALNKQKEDDLDVRVHDFKGGSESDPVSNSKGKVFTSQRQNRTDTGKTEKAAVRQGSPKDVSETKASDAEQRKAKVVPSKDLPVPSAEHQQELSPKKNLRSSKNQQGSSKASQHLVHEKQTAQQTLPEDTVTKRLAKSPRKKLKKSVKKSSSKQPRLERVFPSSSESEAGEEEVEREPVKLNEECIPLLPQELQTSVSQKSGQSEKPNNVLHPLEALGADNKTLVKALEYLIDSVKNSEKKRLPAESSREIPKSICHRTSEGVCSDSESAESQADSDSCSVQDVANKNQKLPDVKRKSNRRKRDVQHERHVLEAVNAYNGVVLNVFSVNSENLDFQASALLSDSAARQKIVMPTNTPNVRRTKRIRLRPLEYWRGERVNYTVNPSGNLVVSGIVCPETEPPRKIKQKRDGHKQKKDEKRSTTPAYLDHTLADTSKKTTVLNPVTNTEVLLRCVNTDIRHKCFYKDEAVEVYKNLSTSAFATGRLILKPFKEKGRQFVHMDTVAFHILHGKIIFTLHNTSYSLTTGSCFYVPAGNEYNIRNLDEESVLVFTQLKVNKNT
ncbi:CENPC protein, partial [Baryphthengus martii]|nr:CENPC protein [Baryphthengus martii]